MAKQRTIDMLKSRVIIKDYSKDAERTALVSGENLAHMFGKIARWYTDISWVGHKHVVADITDFPVLGTAASKDVPASGDAGNDEVVMGNDSRLTDARTPLSHTHTEADITNLGTYAEGATKGGAATSANKLNIGNSDIGNSTTPVYFDSETGLPIALSYTIEKSVPADAVFTDTTYSTMGPSGSSHAGGLVPDTPSTAGTSKYLREDGTWAVPPNSEYVHPSYTPYSSGLYKITVDTLGHVSAASAVTGADLPSHSHTVSDITNFPTLGTAAGYDVPATGDADDDEVVLGNDSRLSDARTPLSHTHTEADISDLGTYAGASTKGGAATSANKLNIGSFDIGSETKPVYFSASSGKPVACVYSLNASVPANAVFTDINVKQSPSTANESREVLFAGNTGNTETTGTTGKSNKLYFNPSTGVLTATSFSGSVDASNLTGSIDAARLPNSGVTANSYGPAAGGTLAYGGTFDVPYVTVDKYGRLTAASTKTFTMPAQYTHPSYTSKTSGLYKITVDSLGHVSGTAAVTASDLPSHTHNYISSSGITSTTEVQINPTGASYNEGLRIGKASNGWSNINFGCSNSATAGTQSGQWSVGVRGAVGATAGGIGDFIIEHNGASGNGLTLYADGSTPRWNNVEISMSGHTHPYLPESTVTGSPDLDTYLTSGVYHIKTQTSEHAPTTNHATLFVDGTVGTPYQLFIPDVSNGVWYSRYKSGSSAWSSWLSLKMTDTVYTHPTTSGNKHIPSGGSSGQYLKWSSDGTATWSAIAASDLPSHTHSYLPLSGGTMTGAITFQVADGIKYNAASATYTMISFITGDTNGHGISIGGGGLTVLGSGESASALISALSLAASNETTYIASDNNIEFYSNCQTIGNRLGIVFDTSGRLRPNANNTRTLGGTDYYWNKAYINQVIGRGTGGSWISARDNTVVKQPSMSTTSAYFPVISTKTKLGEWSIGTLGPDDESIYFAYTTDANYSAGTNNNKWCKINSDGAFSGSASKWTTARTLTIGSTGKSVDGSGNVSWSLSEIGAAATSHTHSNYLPQTTPTAAPDLNTYTTTGIYHIGMSATNAPVTQHSTVYVEAGVGTPYQLFKPDNVDTTWYTRHKITDGWSDWVALKLTDTVYTHPTYTSKTSGLYKITVDGTGHVSSTAAVTASDLPAHTHDTLYSSFVSTLDTTTNTWAAAGLNGSGHVIKSIRTNTNAPAYLLNDFSAGIGFGGGDTRGVISVKYNTPIIRFAGGNKTATDGGTATWYFTLAATSAQTYTLPSTGGTLTDIIYKASNYYATSGHTHSYLPLSGGTMTGAITLVANKYGVSETALNCNNSNITGVNRIIFADLADSSQEGLSFYRSSNVYDNFWIKNGVMYFTPNKTNEDGNDPTTYTVYHSGNCTYSTVGAAAASHTHSYLPLSGGTLTGNLTMGSSTQTTLPNCGITVHDIRSVNVPASGFNSNGRLVNFYFHMADSPNTSQWWSIMHVKGWTSDYNAWELAGTAHNDDARTRPLYVRTSQAGTAWGSWRKIYDSSNKPTPSEIGAAASSHSHSEYLPLAGGTMTGDILFTGVTSTSYPAVSKTIQFSGSTDAASIFFEVTASDKGCLVIQTTDDPDAKIVFRNKVTSGGTRANEVTITDGVIAGNGSGLTSLNASNISSGTLAEARLPKAYIPLAGSTAITGNLRVSMGNAAGPAISVYNGTYEIGLHVGTGGTNHGIYDFTPSINAWMCYHDGTKNIFNGQANTAVTATKSTYVDYSPSISIQTGSSAQAKISLQTLINWLINTKKVLPTGVFIHKIIQSGWSYAANDILQLTCSGTNYEVQLAGVALEFIGTVSSYNTGEFRMMIHTSPTISFTVTSGYKAGPTSSTFVYTCNGSGYTPTWRLISNGLKYANGYWGLTDPSGGDADWTRTTSLGIIPYQSGGLNAGHQSIGTSAWYFSHIYVDNFHGCTLALGSSSVQGRIDIQSTTSASVSYNSANPRIRFKNAGGDQNIDIIMSDYDSVRAPAAISIHGNQGGEYLLAPNVSAWDYTNNKSMAILSAWSLGTTSAVGQGRVIVGNGTKKGTAGNARGYIEIYSEEDGCVFLVSPTTITTAQSGYVVTLPSSAGTLELVGHTHSQYLPKSTVTGSPDLDSYTTTGIYTINTSTATHSPTTNYSTLFVDGSIGTPYQILKPDANDTTWYTRHRNNSAGTWYSWVALNLNGISKSDLYTILWSGSTSCTARSSTSITLTTAISANKYRFIKVIWNCGSYTGTSEFRADTLNVTNNIPSSSDATTMNIIQFKIASDGKSITVGPGTTTITVLQIAGVYPI